MTTEITVIGNIVDDPELRFTPSGAAVCNFTVADNERIKDQSTGEWKDGDATFYRCDVWRETAENVAESLQKGQRVIVKGRVKNRKYEKQDGTVGYSLEISVDAVGPDLRWATAKVTRTAKGGNGGGQQGGGYSAPQGGQQSAPQGDPWGAPQTAGAAAGGANPWGAQQGNDEPPF